MKKVLCCLVLSLGFMSSALAEGFPIDGIFGSNPWSLATVQEIVDNGDFIEVKFNKTCMDGESRTIRFVGADDEGNLELVVGVAIRRDSSKFMCMLDGTGAMVEEVLDVETNDDDPEKVEILGTSMLGGFF